MGTQTAVQGLQIQLPKVTAADHREHVGGEDGGNFVIAEPAIGRKKSLL